VWGIRPALKPERQFRRPTGADLAIRTERNYPTKAICFEHPSLQWIWRKVGTLDQSVSFRRRKHQE